MSSLMSTYAPLEVAFERGAGAWLYDQNGDAYLDALCGIAVCGLGHAHPAITQALAAQAGQVVHTSNIYRIPLQEQLGERLTSIAGMDKVFFSNSGAEANEAAIKLTRLHGHQKDISRPKIVVMERAFHGRTLATLSATGSAKVQKGFSPLVQGFVRVPYGDIAAIKKAAQEHEDIVAVMLEPIQGEGGIHVAPEGFLMDLRRLCDERDWLLMFDEVQSGMARTGQWFACQHKAVKPDVMTLAKALGNGVPIGACLTRGKASELFQPGSHGTTFGGNPLACRAALAVIEAIEQEQLWQRAESLGRQIQEGLRAELADCEGVIDIRGKGLMIGVELDRSCQDLVAMALEKHLLINVTANTVIRLLPPLIMSEDEADQIVSGVSDVVHRFLSQ